MMKNQKEIASHLPQANQSDRPFQQNKPDRPPNQPQHDRISPTSRKAIANFSKTDRFREKESATRSHR
jgi:hypothetical protein